MTNLFASIRRRAKGGFTLIELLVVIAIIGILASIVLASLNSARQKARDARRVADIKSMQLALELFFDTCGGYPLQISAVLATASTYTGCASTVVNFLSAVPTAPVPPSTNTYLYCSSATPGGACDATNGASYKLTFTLEKNTGSLTGGDNHLYTASPTGIAP